jgi:hypothetical protein
MSTQRNTRPSSLELNWPTTEEQHPTDDASIYLMFHGLMCFAYNDTTGYCEVGMHSKAPDHDFKIFVFELQDHSIIEPPIYSFEPDSHDDVPGGVVTVDIEEPTKPGVHFHFPDFPDEFTWEQLLDLEGPNFYDRKLEKKRNTLKPKVTVNHGLFFVIPTTKPFLKIEEGTLGTSELGRIDFIAVGAVNHDHAGTITIKTLREKITLRASTDRPLLVFFSNACLQDECTSNQSDFPLYYKAFKIKSHERKFRLEVIPRSEDGLALGKLAFFSDLFQKEPLRSLVSNNDAPCGAAGYGRSRGTDDSTV